MAEDDLTAPLGLAPQTRKSRPVLRRIAGGAGLLAGVGGVAAGWAVLVHDPVPATPTAVAKVEAAADPKSTAGIRPTAKPAEDDEADIDTDSGTGRGLSDIAPTGGLSDVGGDVIIHDPSAPGVMQLAAAPSPDLVEDGPYGPLPRIGTDGTRPIDAYARPFDAGDRMPRIALVVGGIGIAEASTSAAIALPGDVTLAFAPYGSNLEGTLRRARYAGHEILLQIPLEPYGYPRNDPGPKTLTLAASDAENLDRLHWLMSRITTYVGVVNYLGARFTNDADKLQPVIEEIGRRGLLYLDDGSSVQSRADQVSRDAAPFGRADVVLDAVTEAGQIDARLNQLEAIAKERGYAIGTGTAFPVTIDRIAAFAKAAAERGIEIVPVTALIHSDRT